MISGLKDSGDRRGVTRNSQAQALRDKVPVMEIARRLGIFRRTVKRYPRSEIT